MTAPRRPPRPPRTDLAPPPGPGDPAPTRAEWWRVLADRVARLLGVRGASPIATAVTAGGGVSVRLESLVPPVQWVELTSRISQGRYGYRKARPLVDGTWESYGDKRDDLYEVNGLDAHVGSYVEAYQSPVGDWRFQSLCCDCIAQVCVSVQDCCGGVEGASVIVSYTGPIDPETGLPTIVVSEECTTDSTGGCCVEVPSGYTYQVGVTAPGYTSPGLTTADVTTCAQVLVEITLECCEIELTLTRCGGGEPLPYWGVSLISLDDPPQLCPWPIAQTDENGVATWLVRPGEYEIRLVGWTASGDSDPCDGIYTEGPITVEDCPATIPIAITVACAENSCDGVHDRVHVLSSCYGHLLPGATVSLDWAGCDTYSGTTDSSGLFTFDASGECKSCPGTLTLTISKSRFTTAVVTQSYGGYCGLYDYWFSSLEPSASYACGVPGCPDPIAKTLYLTVTHVGTATFPPAGAFTLTWDSGSTDWLSPCDGSNGRYRWDSATGILVYLTYASPGCTGAVLATYAFTNVSTTCPPSFSSTQRRYIPDLTNYAEGVVTE